MRTDELILDVARPYVRRELPGWGRVFDLFGLGRSSRRNWSSCRPRIVRGKLHGLRMELDVAFWRDRQTYLLGRFWELDVQAAILALLPEGGHFLDIGANTGMLTLVGAAAVGESGLVQCVEPNPRPAAQLERNVALNGLTNVILHKVAVSNCTGTAVLKILSGHDASGSLNHPAGTDPKAVTDEMEVPLVKGDGLFASADRPVDLIKIDVEGHEPAALEGMEELLRRDRPPVIAEYLGAAETDASAVMERMGYRPRILETEFPRFGRPRLRTRPAERVRAGIQNVVWLPEERLDALLQRLDGFEIAEK